MNENRMNSGKAVVIEQIRMKRSLTLTHCVSFLCAVTGHISVFVAPTAILRYTGSIGLSLILWLLGGLINLSLALCFTELATMLPKAGGPYAYINQVFGAFLGFMTMWGYLMLICGPFWALMGYTAAIYITKPFYPDCNAPILGVKMLAAWIVVTFVAMNCVYVKFVTKIQSVLSMTKLLALLLIIVCGVFSFVTGDVTPGYEDTWEGTSHQPAVIAMSFLFSIFTYGGWQSLTNLMEEVKEPGRDLPRAVYISFMIITVEFVLVNWAYYVVVPVEDILNSETVAVEFFHRFYPPLKSVISILVAITTIGVLNASILGHSRYSSFSSDCFLLDETKKSLWSYRVIDEHFARISFYIPYSIIIFALIRGSRNEQAPVIFCMISTKFFTPWPAVILLCIWALVMLFSGGLFMMLEYISVFSILMSFFVVSALVYLRWKSPDAPRPYKTNIVIPISQLVLLLAIFVLCIYQEPYKLGRALIILAAGAPVYLIGIKWQNKPQAYRQAINSFTMKVQKLLLVRKSA